jgi:hypothetical protein
MYREVGSAVTVLHATIVTWKGGGYKGRREETVKWRDNNSIHTDLDRLTEANVILIRKEFDSNAR